MQSQPASQSPTKKPAALVMELFLRLKLFDVIHALWPDRLTVLAYHRITDPYVPDFDTFKPNVSATPTAFAAQMDFMQQRFNIVSINQVVAWLQGEQSLPARAALITFDDGYRDNLDHALPVLQARNLPAVIFLATDYMGRSTPFYWDLIAYCFHHTSYAEANLPLTGPQTWSDEKSRHDTMMRWLELLKTRPDGEKWTAVRKLPQLLGVSVPEDAFAGLHLTWDQVRSLVAAGIDMGAHTQSHPILTRISLDQARTELSGSKTQIETEIGRPVTAFAYPNGQPTDFNPALEQLLQQEGFKAAFTLVPGPTSLAEAKKAPMAIRRVFLQYRDTLPRFAAKVIGLPRVLKRLG